MKRKNVVVLGSTGTIGRNTLDVVSRFSDRFKVIGLSANNNIDLLVKQIYKYSPEFVAVGKKGLDVLSRRFSKKRLKVFDVALDLPELLVKKNVDIIVIGMSGSAALMSFLAAVRSGKTVATANKEALVVAGDIIMREAARYGATVIPIDSEQSAIFQCLRGEKSKEVRKIYLTASGGALAGIPKAKFNQLKVSQILRHPRWKMGKKITVDSATLMNKGFEVIEAQSLFGLDVDQIEVVVHPQAIIHSMVGFADGSILAQLGVTDMRLPIQYALTFPDRLRTNLEELDFFKLKKMTFGRPNYRKFPSLKLAIDVAKRGGTFPSAMNAADEVAVDAFLEGKIRFTQIYDIVEKVVLKNKSNGRIDIKKINETDLWAREEALSLVK